MFNSTILPNDCQIINRVSDTGDECHHDIENISNGAAKRILNDRFQSPLLNGHICDNDLLRPFEQRDLLILEDSTSPWI